MKKTKLKMNMSTDITVSYNQFYLWIAILSGYFPVQDKLVDLQLTILFLNVYIRHKTIE